MNLLKVSIIACVAGLWTHAAVAQTEGVANDRDGIVLFVESMPAIQYRHLGTVTCATFSPDEEDPLIDHIIKQARKEHQEFDGLIFRPGSGLCKTDVIQFYKDPKAKRSRGRGADEPAVKEEYKQSKAIEKNGMLVFVQNNPKAEFTLLGKVETPVTFRSKAYEDLLVEIMRIAKETYPDLDAIVVAGGSGLRKANVIKFK